jgi:hypothetical protein
MFAYLYIYLPQETSALFLQQVNLIFRRRFTHQDFGGRAAVGVDGETGG